MSDSVGMAVLGIAVAFLSIVASHAAILAWGW